MSNDVDELGKFVSKFYNLKRVTNRRELEMANAQVKHDQEYKDLLIIAMNLGIRTVGIAVGDNLSLQSLIDLKLSFNFETKMFV